MVNANIDQFLQNVVLVVLTHTLDSSIPSWNGNCGFSHAIKMDYDQACRVQSLRILAGIGTHLDALSRFIKDAHSAADIAVQNPLAPVSLINVARKVH